jgi:hypothetical protein
LFDYFDKFFILNTADFQSASRLDVVRPVKFTTPAVFLFLATDFGVTSPRAISSFGNFTNLPKII